MFGSEPSRYTQLKSYMGRADATVVTIRNPPPLFRSLSHHRVVPPSKWVVGSSQLVVPQNTGLKGILPTETGSSPPPSSNVLREEVYCVVRGEANNAPIVPGVIVRILQASLQASFSRGDIPPAPLDVLPLPRRTPPSRAKEEPYRQVLLDLEFWAPQWVGGGSYRPHRSSRASLVPLPLPRSPRRERREGITQSFFPRMFLCHRFPRIFSAISRIISAHFLPFLYFLFYFCSGKLCGPHSPKL